MGIWRSLFWCDSFSRKESQSHHVVKKMLTFWGSLYAVSSTNSERFCETDFWKDSSWRYSTIPYRLGRCINSLMFLFIFGHFYGPRFRWLKVFVAYIPIKRFKGFFKILAWKGQWTFPRYCPFVFIEVRLWMKWAV